MQMGALITSSPGMGMGHDDFTTEPPIIRPPMEAFSLVNKVTGPTVSFFHHF